MRLSFVILLCLSTPVAFAADQTAPATARDTEAGVREKGAPESQDENLALVQQLVDRLALNQATRVRTPPSAKR